MKTFCRGLLYSVVGLALAGTLHAGKYNPDKNIGDAAPAWADLPGADGESHSLASQKDRKAVVVVFTCNSCPYACLLYTSPSPRDQRGTRMPSSA